MNEGADTSANTQEPSTDEFVDSFNFEGDDIEDVNPEVEDTEQVDETETSDSGNEESQEVEDATQDDTQDDGTEGMSEEERKEHNRVNAERRIAARQQQEQASSEFLNRLRQEAAEKFLGDQDEDKYQDIAEQEGETVAEQQRRLDAMERRAKEQMIESELKAIESFQSRVGMEVAQAENSIPLMNPRDKQNYDPEVAADIQRAWAKEHAVIQMDDNGNAHILGQRDNSPSLYEYAQERANFYSSLLKKAATRGQQVARMNASTADFRPTSQPTSNVSEEQSFVNSFFD